MSRKSVICRLTLAAALFWAVPAWASDIGHEVANQVSLASYQHYLDDLLYTHDGNNRNALCGPDKEPARENIVDTFESFGLDVEVEPFVYQGTTCYNVIATQVGMVYPDAYYVIGAHYDSKSNPGADDNASGVAGVLEIARILSACESEYTIKYMAFDAEEYGLIGSDFYVDNHYYDDIRGMISMDMIAWNTGSNKAEVYGFASSAAIKSVLNSAIAQYGQGLTAELFTETSSRSDHGPFQSAGFQACLLIEGNSGSNPCYHTACDSVDNAGYINYTYAVRMARSVAGYLVDNAHVAPPIDCQTGEGCDVTPDHDEDCNGNGVWDRCDIRCGTSNDWNANGIPDECEPHETWYVNCANCPGPGSGSEADPFCTIQMAIDAAASGMTSVVEIIVADGTYTGTGNKDLDFGGKLITLRSQNGAANCVIDCEGSGRGFYFHSGETAAAVVNGLTIRNGSVDSSIPGGACGGGVFCSGASPTVSNCIISGNTASSGGGGVCCRTLSSATSSSSPTLTNCTIRGNTASSGSGVYCGTASSTFSSSPTLRDCSITGNSGGGVFCYSSSSTAQPSRPTLTDCTISGNTTRGGVVCDYYSRPTLNGCTITGNTTLSYGGGGVCCLDGSSPTLTDCTISDNTTSSFSFGGGVYCRSYSPCRPRLTNCTISGNSAGYDGGGVYYTSSSASSSLAMANCTITSNRAGRSGGGAYCAGPNARLLNCVISTNTATGSSDSAGGVYCSSYSPTLVNCTISGNTASGSTSYYYTGGGLYCASSNPNLTNCILWGNTPQEIYVYSGSPVVTYCDVQGGWTGTGNVTVDPGFALADDFHLLPGSPCIDAGTNTPASGLPNEDADGNLRPVDGNGDSSPVADMGAYEFDPASPAIALSPAALNLFAYAGGPSPDPRTLSIRNCAGGLLAWEIAEDCSWLSFNQPSGSCQQEIDSVVVSFDTAGLSVGEYSCVLTVWASQATNSPRSLPVKLHLGAARQVPVQYSTIQAAINASAKHDWVLVADGVWVGTGNKNLDFAGRIITLCSLNGPTDCIIDCEGDGRGFYFHTGESPLARVDGFTIRGASSSGLYFTNCSPTIDNCVITGNAGSSNGGGVYCSSSSPTLSKCMIVANTAASSGGGVFCGGASPALTSCTIAANIASSGGGLYCVNTSFPTLTNCTIAANGANSSGGGVYCSSSNPKLANCILWGDTPQEVYLSSSGSSPVVTYCDVQGGWTGTGNLNTDPLFVNAANGDFHLASNSPCIDAGDPASDFSLEPEPDGGRINMGAYGNTPEAESKGWLYIQGYNLVEKTRVGRTLFDYRLSVRVKNESATDTTAVSLELLHMPSNVTIIEPLVDVGSVPAGATATSVDTFTIRVDRRTLISELGISWRLTYTLSGATEDRTFAGSLSRETLEPSYVPIEDVPLPVRDSAAGPPAPASVATTPN